MLYNLVSILFPSQGAAPSSVLPHSASPKTRSKWFKAYSSCKQLCCTDSDDLHPSFPPTHFLSLVITPLPQIELHPIQGIQTGQASVIQVFGGFKIGAPLINSLDPHSERILITASTSPLTPVWTKSSDARFSHDVHAFWKSIPIFPLVLVFCLTPPPHDMLQIDHSDHADHDGQVCWLQIFKYVAVALGGATVVVRDADSFPTLNSRSDLLHDSQTLHSPKYMGMPEGNLN